MLRRCVLRLCVLRLCVLRLCVLRILCWCRVLCCLSMRYRLRVLWRRCSARGCCMGDGLRARGRRRAGMLRSRASTFGTRLRRMPSGCLRLTLLAVWRFDCRAVLRLRRRCGRVRYAVAVSRPIGFLGG